MLAATGLTWLPGAQRLYKWMPADRPYDPCNPYPALGRFGDGSHSTVYVAESARGAMAEFFRRHPELLNFQDDLTLQMFELDLEVNGACLDLREAAAQARAGIDHDRLTSSESDESIRYAECQHLALAAIAEGCVGIGYPSAAANWDTWNLVLFGSQDTTTWICHEHHNIGLPRLSATEVRPLPH